MQAQSETAASGSAKWKGLGVRIAAAMVMIPCVLAVTWLGGIWFVVLVAAIGVAASAEWVRIVFDGSKPQFALHGLAVIIASLFVLKFSMLSSLALVAFVWSASLLLAGAGSTRVDIWKIFAVPYIALPMAALVHLRLNGGNGLLAILWIFAVVWVADTMAYAFGRTIGGPKLAPVISPNKTWAGLLGAVVGGAAASFLVIWLGGLNGSIAVLVLGGAMGCIGQIGDLYESAAKRRRGIKDSGSLIPGHGGVMDRVDALLAVAVAALIVGAARNGLPAAANGLLIW